MLTSDKASNDVVKYVYDAGLYYGQKLTYVLLLSQW